MLLALKVEEIDRFVVAGRSDDVNQDVGLLTPICGDLILLDFCPFLCP